MIHAAKIEATAALSTVPRAEPSPKIVPQLTCVVDTGKPSLEANKTSDAVTMLPARPCLESSG